MFCGENIAPTRWCWSTIAQFLSWRKAHGYQVIWREGGDVGYLNELRQMTAVGLRRARRSLYGRRAGRPDSWADRVVRGWDRMLAWVGLQRAF